MGNRVRRPEDDDRATRPAHPLLSYPRNRKRQLPLQKQLGESRQAGKGEASQLDDNLTQTHHQAGSLLGGNPGSVLSGNRHRWERDWPGAVATIRIRAAVARILRDREEQAWSRSFHRD